jgi:magnesium chelatase family protein
MRAAAERTCRVLTLCLHGAQARIVEIELQHTGGLMQRLILTGLPGGALREARDRVRACLQRCGLPALRRSVLAHFAPADLPKEGNGFDLPLALGLLALERLLPEEALAGRAVLGELALDGRLRPVRGALALALAARHVGVKRILLPAANGSEVALVRGLQVEAVESLDEALAVLAGAPSRAPPPAPAQAIALPDLADVRGQPSARRALEIAAAGRHNLLLCGPPGTGKTMLAQRLPSLLPPLDERSSLRVTALHGLGAGGPPGVVHHPPFRAPHHTCSLAALLGGGPRLLPGEISLAHGGVLFLDELPEFSRALLEALRQPLEERVVRLALAGRAARFPAACQLVAAMNPCACGYRGHPKRGCACSDRRLRDYFRRISGPLLDRFDLFVDVPPPEAGALLAEPASEPSVAVRARVLAARQTLRGVATRAASIAVRGRLELAMTDWGLSGRGVARTLAVARSIAALAGAEQPAVEHVDEALSFRRGLLDLRAK